MSAMDEYKRVCAIVRGEEYWAISRSEVADAADVVIAELEAALAHEKESGMALSVPIDLEKLLEECDAEMVREKNI